MDDTDLLSDASDRQLLEAALVRSAAAETLLLGLWGVMHRQNPDAIGEEFQALSDELQGLRRNAAPQDLRRQTLERLVRLLSKPTPFDRKG